MDDGVKCARCGHTEDLLILIPNLCYQCGVDLQSRAYRDIGSLPQVIAMADIHDKSLPMVVSRLRQAVQFLTKYEGAAGTWAYPEIEVKK